MNDAVAPAILASAAAPLAFGDAATAAFGVRTRGRADPVGFAVPRTPDGYPALPDFDAAAIGRHLRQRFPNLRHHFIFEYYPWYGTNPWRHWQQWDRTPPFDIAATSMPYLWPYDSRDARVLEQHAQWIVENGAGAIDVSWWGRLAQRFSSTPTLPELGRERPHRSRGPDFRPHEKQYRYIEASSSSCEADRAPQRPHSVSVDSSSTAP